ncbi:hypothetical protein Tco_1020236 [Tanacetum coccineum]|uniref:Reverse transcriptase domain-containing protein n=1 Tax=Tanacetum coccineum TaxID=301880 RepID=A0ABQ5FZQ2_9ASTR
MSRRRDLKERLGPRHARSVSGSPEPRRGHSESPRESGLKRKTMFKRLENGVFHMLGEKEKRGHWKSKPKRQKSSVEDDLSQPWVCEETDPFTPRIRYFDFLKTRMPSHIKTYDGSEDPEDHLKIFQAAAKTERWAMPMWCHMFNSTLTENARVRLMTFFNIPHRYPENFGGVTRLWYQKPSQFLLNDISAFTYTFVYTDSEPGRAFWGADDEEISERGIPWVIVLGYDGLLMQPVASPSPDYIPGLEDPQTPPVPQDEDEHEPMFVHAHDPDYVPEPIYPEYIPLDDEHEFPAEEQPLPPDPEEYEDDEIEDGPVDNPMDGEDDGDDDDGDSSGDDADDEDEDDEDEEEEEEKHLAPADSAVVVPADEAIFPPKGT